MVIKGQIKPLTKGTCCLKCHHLQYRKFLKMNAYFIIITDLNLSEFTVGFSLYVCDFGFKRPVN